MKHEVLPIWKCDCCGKEIQSKNRPSGPYDAWAVVTIDQDTAFDIHGAAWANHKTQPIDMCGDCAQAIWNTIGTLKEAHLTA